MTAQAQLHTMQRCDVVPALAHLTTQHAASVPAGRRKAADLMRAARQEEHALYPAVPTSTRRVLATARGRASEDCANAVLCGHTSTAAIAARARFELLRAEARDVHRRTLAEIARMDDLRAEGVTVW